MISRALVIRPIDNWGQSRALVFAGVPPAAFNTAHPKPDVETPSRAELNLKAGQVGEHGVTCEPPNANHSCWPVKTASAATTAPGNGRSEVASAESAAGQLPRPLPNDIEEGSGQTLGETRLDFELKSEVCSAVCVGMQQSLQCLFKHNLTLNETKACWDRIMHAFYTCDLLSEAEIRENFSFEVSRSRDLEGRFLQSPPRVREARHRLVQMFRSLVSFRKTNPEKLPSLRAMRSLTVVIPMYNETVYYSREELITVGKNKTVSDIEVGVSPFFLSMDFFFFFSSPSITTSSRCERRYVSCSNFSFLP